MRRLVAAIVGCLLATASWAALNAWGVPVPAQLLWVLCPLGLALAAGVSWLAGAAPGIAGSATRFWRRLALAAALVTVGTAIITPSRLSPGAPSALRLIQVSAPLLLLGILVALYALLRLPVRARTRAEWARLGLDGLTVLVTTVLFLWHFVL